MTEETERGGNGRAERTKVWQRSWFVLGLAVLTVVGTAFGLASLIYARRSAARPQLSVLVRSSTVLDLEGKAASWLSVVHGQEVVPRVTEASVHFSNTGPEDILGQQIVAKDPLRICLPPGAKVLRKQVNCIEEHAVASPRIATRAGQDGSTSLDLGFEILKPGYAFTVWVLHSGHIEDLAVKGTIARVPDIRTRYEATVNGPAVAVRLPAAAVAAVCIGLVVLILASGLALKRARSLQGALASAMDELASVSQDIFEILAYDFGGALVGLTEAHLELTDKIMPEIDVEGATEALEAVRRAQEARDDHRVVSAERKLIHELSSLSEAVDSATAGEGTTGGPGGGAEEAEPSGDEEVIDAEFEAEDE